MLIISKISKNNIIKYLKTFDLISDRVCTYCPMSAEHFLPFLRKHNINEDIIKYYSKVTCAERFAFLTSSNAILLINNGCIGRKETLKKIIKKCRIIDNE